MRRSRHLLQTTPTRERDQRGAVTAWVLFLVPAMLAVAGLVIDATYTLGAKREAMNDAEQAARVGSDALSESALRSGITAVSHDQAVAAAQTYLSRVGATGTVSVDGGTVTVVITGERDTTLLSAVGVDSLPYTAEASAVSINEDD
ncbi:MAG TPA: pilus assembly protein TadG-related protein [Nocardioides sp.]|uniref:pilus assembly protein TadG-related protein n=1 Tax=Nocardioides sp. TaxID=35761 RepID=UPI002EDB1231